MPGVAQRVPGGLGSQIFVTFGTWRWWGRQPQAPATFTSTNVPVTHFLKGLSRPRAMVRSEGNMSLKNLVTPPGIDPGTVQLVAQRLNYYVTQAPLLYNLIQIHVFSYLYFSLSLFIIIIIIIYLSWIWATYWPVPISRIQKSLRRSAMIPSASSCRSRG